MTTTDVLKLDGRLIPSFKDKPTQKESIIGKTWYVTLQTQMNKNTSFSKGRGKGGRRIKEMRVGLGY